MEERGGEGAGADSTDQMSLYFFPVRVSAPVIN